MIIIDFSGSLHFNVHSLDKMGEDITKENLRIGLLNSLLFFMKEFKQEYGPEVVVALDGNSWRKDKFEYYKFKRKESRDKDKFDWKEIHKFYSEIIEEFKGNLPYKFLRLEGAEADDIVAKLVRYKDGEILIIGSDKDYLQLQLNSKVKQYCPMKKEYITADIEDIKYKLFFHIMKGDSSDGIPSVINKSNCFYKGIRQKPLRETYIKETYEKAKNGELEEFVGEEIYNRFIENKELIDFRCIPTQIQEKIVSSFEEYGELNYNVYKYITTHNLNNFFEEINNF